MIGALASRLSLFKFVGTCFALHLGSTYFFNVIVY